MAVFAQLHELVNIGGQRGGDAGNVAGHHDGRAEFAQCARKRQQGSRQQSAFRQRQRDGEEHAPFARAQRAGHLLQRRIHLLNRGTRRPYEQGK
jgi:hypothetical protein